MKRALGLALVLATTGACTKQNRAKRSIVEPSADIFSNRPIGAVPDLFVVTLEAPALLTVAKPKPGGGLEIPADAKRAVLEEQTKFEEQLKTLAPDAKILYRYRLTLNGVALFASPEVAAAIQASGARITQVRAMGRPQVESISTGPRLTSSTTSVSYIGAEKAHTLGFTGKGMRIGVIDTGVDYTHSMLGGRGDKSDYAGIDPNLPSPLFPNKKVVGGIDLVGTDFDASSNVTLRHLPIPDANPIDEAGHGTHVAGTIAGVGDGANTYSGVAPDAEIYGIKVFGRDGSTGDAVVIAGFEYAVDPDGDLDPNDHLDAVNLSLGGGFGQPQILYSEAVRNVTRAGTVVVASAGNSGPVDYIVGAPSTSDEAISVAASIDGSPHNWQFRAVRFSTTDGTSWLTKAVEGPISAPIEDSGQTEGALLDIGLADRDLGDDVKAALRGKVALIMRGKVPFAEKLKRAEDAGAIGAVVINNAPGDHAAPMGGDGAVAIPAIIVGNDTGVRIQKALSQGEVRIQFKTPDKVFEPEVIDTITDFSSKGPRSEDNLFKPEIAAPGSAIISAAMGGGRAGTQMSGTSMAAPHMTGVIALLKQSHPTLSALEIKSLAMGTSHILGDAGSEVPMTLQGAGRVDLERAIDASLIVSPGALSLGRVQVGTSRKLTRTISVKNISNRDLDLTFAVKAPSDLRISLPSALKLAAGHEATLPVEIEVTMSGADFSAELDGRIFFMSDGTVAAQLPAMAIATQASGISGQTPGADHVTLSNSSPLDGIALAFNLLGEDEKKTVTNPSLAWKSRSCDLQSAGYRIVTRKDGGGTPTEYLQVAFKLYTPLTTWIQCDVSALIDADGDGIAEQELAGSFGGNLEGFGVPEFVSLLLDAKKSRDIRLAFEQAVTNGEQDPSLDYHPAILAQAGMMPFPHSTVAVIEAPLALIAKGADGLIHLKLAAQGGDTDMVERDDFLGTQSLGDWKTLPGSAVQQGYSDLPETLAIKGLNQADYSFKRGTGAEKLVIYFPNNELLLNGSENQSRVF